MKHLAIKAENISKQYRLGEVGTGTLSHDLNRFWSKVRGKEDPYLKIGDTNDRTSKGGSEYVWSLKDINFEIEQGEAVGIIGRNGAGKSTLLKLLSKVTKPTTGSFKVKGRIASLLEVGTGFNPEMTGRENIYMNGAILGMRRYEINRKFDEIVAFSGVEKYIDTPVKRYSSGMYVRLAFAVAAHLESEILIVDEVLAVGDAEFQKKCLGKMGDLSNGEGRTVLFVSHNMAAVEQLCNRAILLENGSKTLDSKNVKSILTKYLSEDINSELFPFWYKSKDKVHSPYIDLDKFYISDSCGGTPLNFYSRDNEIFICVEFNIREVNNLLEIGCIIYDENDIAVFTTQHTDLKQELWATIVKGENKLCFTIPPNFLNEGQYRIELVSYLYLREILYSSEKGSPSIYFNIGGKLSDSPYWYKKRSGILAPICKWYNYN
jgi:lipopolysaccharide transport system ATP-binding protein